MATGLRIGWALVNQQSVVSSAMIVALGSLALVAVLNWPPLTLLVDTALRWPNISVGLSQMALVVSAAGSCVMITSVASTRRPEVTRRLAIFQYVLAAVIAALTLALFMIGERQPRWPLRSICPATSAHRTQRWTGWCPCSTCCWPSRWCRGSVSGCPIQAAVGGRCSFHRWYRPHRRGQRVRPHPRGEHPGGRVSGRRRYGGHVAAVRDGDRRGGCSAALGRGLDRRPS